MDFGLSYKTILRCSCYMH